MALTPSVVLTPTALASGSSPRNVTFNIGTPTANALLVVAILNADDSDSVPAVSWADAAMTAAGVIGAGTLFNLSCWTLQAPASGSNSISIAFSGDGTYGGIVYAVLVESDSPVSVGTEATASATGTVVSIASQTCPSGGMLLALAGHNFSGTDPVLGGSGATSIYAGRMTSRPYMVASRVTDGGFAWAALSSSQRWGLIVLPLSVAGGYTHPTLLVASAHSITSTSFRPRVTFSR